MVYAGLLPLLFAARLPVAHLSFAALALGAGGLGGLAFALVGRLTAYLQDTEIAAVAGSLYGADLVGGCVGAVLTSVFLVPLFGIAQTCWTVAAVGLTGLILCTGIRVEE
jgi:hypothetical protein